MMKRIIFVVFALFLVGCNLTENKIQTAIAQSEAATGLLRSNNQ